MVTIMTLLLLVIISKNEYNELLEKEIVLDLKKIAYSSMINE